MPRPPRDAQRIALTRKHLDAIRAQIERTGVSAPALLKRFPGKASVSHAIIHRWLAGMIVTADAKQYRKLLQLWRSLPPRSDTHVAMTPEMIARLHALKEHSGVGPDALLRAAEGVPEKLTAAQVGNWLSGMNTSVRRDHLEFVLAVWEALPAVAVRVDITPQILSELRECRERSGLGIMALLKGTRHERPPGLTSKLVESWLDGRTQSARKDYLHYVLTRWRAVSKYNYK